MASSTRRGRHAGFGLLLLPCLYLLSYLVPVERAFPLPGGMALTLCLPPLLVLPGYMAFRFSSKGAGRYAVLAAVPLVVLFVVHEPLYTLTGGERENRLTAAAGPFVCQTAGNSCFVACVQNLMRLEGLHVRPGPVARAARLSAMGVHPARMARTIREITCRRAVRRWMGPRELAAEGSAAILITLYLGCIPHTVLLCEVAQDRFTVHDPAMGLLVVSGEELRNRLFYTGMAVVVPEIPVRTRPPAASRRR
jgi:hypothetical protein